MLWSLLDLLEGSIWVSIDDREMPYLRILNDEFSQTPEQDFYMIGSIDEVGK